MIVQGNRVVDEGEAGIGLVLAIDEKGLVLSP
jgi:hypothetical protein